MTKHTVQQRANISQLTERNS